MAILKTGEPDSSPVFAVWNDRSPETPRPRPPILGEFAPWPPILGERLIYGGKPFPQDWGLGGGPASPFPQSCWSGGGSAVRPPTPHSSLRPLRPRSYSSRRTTPRRRNRQRGGALKSRVIRLQTTCN